MNNTNTGGPAFPTMNEHQAGNHLWHFEGMTLRDYFAAKALQGMLSDTNVSGSATEFARRSYEMADAMLKAREA